MESEISLEEARRRVVYATGLDLAPWTPGDVRWIAAEWGRLRPELDQCRRLEAELADLEREVQPWWWMLAADLAAGVGWWCREAPVVARAAVALAGLFLMGFVWGWL